MSTKPTQPTALARLLEAIPYFRRAGDSGKLCLCDAVVELSERVAKLEALVARRERDIAPKRKVGGLG
jgi:hypothetical protein